jgi:hypothetical protein
MPKDRSRFPAGMYTRASKHPLYNRAGCANLDGRYCRGVTYRDRGSCQGSLDVIGLFVEVEWDRLRGVARALECIELVRSRLTAGGNRIRTIGPAPAKGSSGRCQSDTAARKAKPLTGSGPKRQCLPGVAAHSPSLRGGTASSNPSSSTGESIANLTPSVHCESDSYPSTEECLMAGLGSVWRRG